MNFLSAKSEVLDNLTDAQLAADLSTLDAHGIALNILSVNLTPKPPGLFSFKNFYKIEIY